MGRSVESVPESVDSSPDSSLNSSLGFSAFAVGAALGLGGVLGVARLRSARPKVGPDAAWWASRGRAQGKARYHGFTRTSRYLTMRDGVRIAIDLYLPKGLAPGERIPTILRQTRYWRRMIYRWPFGFLGRTTAGHILRFVEQGYAWVVVDARGTGASFGTRQQEWSPDEVRDGAEVLDWIVAQPWSSGIVGATGISYDGIAAEFLATNRHPALRAVAPRFSLFDTYADVGFPGGIHLTWFTEVCGHANFALDLGYLDDVVGFKATLFGVRLAATEEDPNRKLIFAARREHAANYDIHAFASELTYADDLAPSSLGTRDMSTYPHADDLEATGIPIYSYSGWYDGANSRAAVNRYLTIRGTPGSRLTLGPWPRGGDLYLAPLVSKREAGFDQRGELLRFFDYHLKGIDTGIAAEPPVHYYTTGEDRWKEAQSWPPRAHSTPCYLAEGSELAVGQAPDQSAHDVYQVDLSAGTGPTSRWNSEMYSTADYPDRAERDRRLLTYTSAPLKTDVEVTGHPLATLYVESSATDGQFFVYLEDVAPDGRVGYVTEGLLRGIHRRLSDDPPYRTPVPYHSCLRADAQPLVPGEVAELVIDLLPISHLFKQGHRIRVALAGADRDHFAPLPGPAPTLRVYRGGERASRVDLPVVGRT